MVAVDRAFSFSLDGSLSPSPIINTKLNRVLCQYLRDVSSDAKFSLSIPQMLIEENRATHQERQNKGKIQCTIKVGDMVKSHIQVQSHTDTDLVGKLRYRARGPYIIMKDLGNNSFEVQQYMVKKGPQQINIKIQNYTSFPWLYSRLKH